MASREQVQVTNMYHRRQYRADEYTATTYPRMQEHFSNPGVCALLIGWPVYCPQT